MLPWDGMASSGSHTSFLPSPFPSIPSVAQVPGMNCAMPSAMGLYLTIFPVFGSFLYSHDCALGLKFDSALISGRQNGGRQALVTVCGGLLDGPAYLAGTKPGPTRSEPAVRSKSPPPPPPSSSSDAAMRRMMPSPSASGLTTNAAASSAIPRLASKPLPLAYAVRRSVPSRGEVRTRQRVARPADPPRRRQRHPATSHFHPQSK